MHTILRLAKRRWALHFVAALLLQIGLFGYALGQVAQKRVSITVGAVSLTEALEEIRKTSRLNFMYDPVLMATYKVQPQTFKDQLVADVLKELLKTTDLQYTSDNDGSILIKKNKTVAGPAGNSNGIQMQGTVTDSTGQALPGVTVMANGRSNIGAVTDANGKFSLLVPNDVKFVNMTMMGYYELQVAVRSNAANQPFVLRANNSALDEVVVVGYGTTQRKASIVGAVQTIKPEDLRATSANLTTSFAGKIAGMISVQRNGAPGADGANFWIRGVSTFGTNTSPLIVLDGVEIVSNMLNAIAPESIESFSILKDATATALYGSRGANGVLIITTKNGGNRESMNVNVRVQGGLSAPTRIQPIADGVKYMETYNEARSNNGQPAYYSQEQIDGTRDKLNPYAFPYNDWYNILFKDHTFNQNANVSVTGGGKKVNYFLNAAFFNETGILKDQATGPYNSNVGLKRYMFQSNVSAAITPTTRIGVKMNTQLNYRQLPSVDVDDLFQYTMKINQVDFPALFPHALLQGADPGITYYGNAPGWDGGVTQINPLALVDRGYAQTYQSYLTTVFNVDQDLKFITQGLKARVLASFFNMAYSNQTRSKTPFYKTLNGYTVDANGAYQLDVGDIGPAGTTYLTYGAGRDGEREYALQGSIEYGRQFGPKGVHDVNALLLYHHRQNDENGITATETEILPRREQGLAGRLTYGYGGRYLAEVNFGYNGSENFISGKRFGFFPSFALGWNVTNEPFFDPIKDKITYLKFRASWGKAGNDALNIRFPYLSTATTNAAIGNLYLGPNRTLPRGISLNAIGNPDATWEESKKTNVGIEVGLFNKLMLIADIFSEKRTGIFMQRRSIPNSAGYEGTTPYANIGAVTNRGVDASLEYNTKISSKLSISLRGAFTYAHNEVTARDEPALTYPYMSVLGHPINTVFGLVAEGLFADQADIDKSPRHTFTAAVKPGDIKYRDMNGDNVIDANDATAIGNPTTPEIVYGFGPSIQYDKFDFSFFFQGTGRVSINMNAHHPFTDGTNSGFNIAKWIADDHWSESNPNPNAAYPRLSHVINQNNVKSSSFWVYNGSFLRLKTLEAGYTYKGFRAYVSGTNLLTFSKFKYWDPEQGSGNGLSYPLQRTYNLGLQYNF
ncbi:SusC/RagA family TonB-linked outer membrane protein [Chitinophaga horti]|uniref:SusC/RagA family TonB-linked outer membrane protein n=1 Tax=Chitinophaga horti TaxID=2920382 RepID=A0ABY6IYI6_9BACT|nr:SusC/RagA family TonB-linked outer membrane protein [Chitinophaga horti]UYQ91211.1 SusC/RagA family TonB-linked outer membrane protein [Chitinophaga horti]